MPQERETFGPEFARPPAAEMNFTRDLWETMPEMDLPPDIDSGGAAIPVTAQAPTKGSGATPFVAGHGYARRFPTETLPPAMRAYVHDLAIRKQVAVDLPALSILGIISAVAGPRITVRRDHDWRQPINLYVCCAVPSGGGKTPVLEELRQGLRKLIARIKEDHAERMANDLARRNQEISDLLHAAGEITTAFDERDRLKARARELQKELERIEEAPPAPPRILLDGDSGVEALAREIAGNEGAGAVVDDEGTFFRILGGLYNGGKTGNLAFVLKGYDCAEYHPLRIGRDQDPIHRAALTLVISPQPNIVTTAMADQAMNEAGFINRFIVSIPGDLIGQRENRPSVHVDDTPEALPGLAGRAWWSTLLSDLGGYEVINDSDPADCATIDLARDAWKRHVEFSDTFDARCHPVRGDLRHISGWATKHPGRVLRIAAVLHLAAGNTADDRLEVETVDAAIAIGDWAVEHYLCAVGQALSDGAGRIKEFVDQGSIGRTRASISSEVFKRNAKAADLTRWMEELVSTGGYELVHMSGDNGGRPSEVLRRAATK